MPGFCCRVSIGYSGTKYLYTAVNLSSGTWSVGSDCRIKKCITPGNIGLSFVERLQPVTFQWRSGCEIPQDIWGHDASDTTPHTKTQYGFIAQDIKAAMDAEPDGHLLTGLWNDGVEPDNRQGVGAGDLVIPLVNAVKELSAGLKALTVRVQTLESE